MPRFSVHYGENAVRLTTVYPAVVETLTQLRDSAAGSASAPTSRSARRGGAGGAGLDRCFGAVIGGDSLPQRKPEPEPLLAVIPALGGARTRRRADRRQRHRPALRRAAGVPAIIIPSGYGNPAQDADVKLTHFGGGCPEPSPGSERSSSGVTARRPDRTPSRPGHSGCRCGPAPPACRGTACR